jgi:hypothetical protein
VQVEVAFWIDTFEKGVRLAEVRTEVMDSCRRTLLEAGFTMSSEVSTNVVISARQGVDPSSKRTEERHG